jgi:2-keto-3-deoxy-L-rhamnonate aldolase RhmA
VENAETILATPGLDLAWLGHYDLSDSLGCAEEFNDPRYLAAEQRLLTAAAAAGKPLGWLVPTGEAARLALRRGFRCICIGHEVAVLRNALTQEFANARKGGPATP